LLEQQFLEWHVIHSRATFLDDIREGFKCTGLFDFIKNREYLWPAVFPTERSLNYGPDEILQQIRYIGEFPFVIKAIVDTFVLGLGRRFICI